MRLLAILLHAPTALAEAPLPGPFDDSKADYDLLPNGTMEAAVSGGNLTRWAPIGEEGQRLIRGPEPVYRGNYAAVLDDSDGVDDEEPVVQESDLAHDLVQGRTYYLTAWIYNDLSGGGEAWIDLGENTSVFQVEKGTSGPCQAASTPGFDGWEFVQCAFKANSGQPKVRMVVSGSSGGLAAFDEVGLTEAADFDPPLSLVYDYDGDGYTTQEGDCDESNAFVNPDAEEIWYDGIDQNCDGLDDYDRDGDGSRRDDDCNDDDRRTYPGAIEVWYDGIDQNCDGASDYDQDRDGFDSDKYGGDDCHDGFSGIYPGATERWYDGVDQSCDGNDDDQDLDGFAASEVGGPDCDDLDPEIHPDVPEIQEDGIDQDCDGVDLVGYVDRTVPPRRQVNRGGPSGCTCSSTGGGAGWPALGLLALALRRRRV